MNIPEYYSQWEGVYAANRAFDHLRQLQTRPFDATESSTLNQQAEHAAHDFVLFQEFVDPEKITSVESFLLGSARRAVPDESARRQNPYTNEVIGRQLDMPWPMFMRKHFPEGEYPGFTKHQATRVIPRLSERNILSLRQALVIGQRGVQRMRGLSTGSVKFIGMLAHTVDPRIEWPVKTSPEYAAKLYDSIEDISAEVLYPIDDARRFTVKDILTMRLSRLDHHLPYDGRLTARHAGHFAMKFAAARRNPQLYDL